MSDDLLRLPPRPDRGHKGTFGTVLVVGGSCGARTMLGGPVCTALAALRSGAGLVELAMPAPILATALSIAPSATGIALPVGGDGSFEVDAAAAALAEGAARATVLAIGPGLGREAGVAALVAGVVAECDRPIVVDADALVALAGCVRGGEPPRLRRPAILTPHPGEFRTLAEALGLAVDPAGLADDPAQRTSAAVQLSKRLGAIVVLKGAGTVVADGDRVWTSGASNPALATGGSGDLLTGLIAGLLAQWHAGPGGEERSLAFVAAATAVELHARAAAVWSVRNGHAGLLAPELLVEIPTILARWRSEGRGTAAASAE